MVNTSEADQKKNTGERTETAGEPEQANKDTVVPDAGNAGRFRIITNVFQREDKAARRVGQLRDKGLPASAKMYRSGQWYSLFPKSARERKPLPLIRCRIGLAPFTNSKNS